MSTNITKYLKFMAALGFIFVGGGVEQICKAASCYRVGVHPGPQPTFHCVSRSAEHESLQTCKNKVTKHITKRAGQLIGGWCDSSAKCHAAAAHNEGCPPNH